MDTDDVKGTGIEKIDGRDFGYWKMQIEDYLYEKKLHLPLLGQKPEAMKDEEWISLDRQVLGLIRLTLTRKVAHNVIKERTTAGLMTVLSGIWEAMRTTISNSAGKSKLNYDDIRDLILGEEVRRRDAGESSTSGSTLNVETRGHIQANCYKMKKEDDDKSANTVAEEGHEALLLSVSSPLDSWVLDSGASFHTTPHQNILQNYVAGDYGVVYLADGEPLRIIGIGDVEIKLPNNSTWRLQQVRHVPELKKNLISVGQLDESGHSINFAGGIWKVSKGVMILARGKKIGTLYMTPALEDIIATAEAENQADLLHYKLGHMSEKGMNYGSDEFGYRFWDGENRKIIRSKNVIFNEKMTYKNKDATNSDKAETSDVIDVDDIAKSIVQGNIIDKENIDPQEEPFTEAGKEMVWLQSFLDELGKKQHKGILYSDNQSVIFLAKNPAFHSRAKHIQLRYHFIRSFLDDGQLILEKIRGSENPSDMLTKEVPIEKLKLCKASVGLQD
ncbi:hypothetical protein DKX38_006172 [Salix brachista]|uniref:GAG-pre-integrase domain-containing protein n=1 Tax=Salix brachista TaxID=2182728 RepID=A0A5N5N166_9ROSI|nr:hypothetical protein DKX38_006172 [Salix brachista]